MCSYSQSLILHCLMFILPVWKQREKKKDGNNLSGKESSPPPSTQQSSISSSASSQLSLPNASNVNNGGHNSTISPISSSSLLSSNETLKLTNNSTEENPSQYRSDPSGSISTKVPLNSSQSQTQFYLQSEFAVFTRSIAECNIHDLIRQPNGVDKNEWIANNIVAFYNHVNVLYNAVSDLCTPITCPLMNGPQESYYYWIDEKNKKIKCSAPQYMDYALMFIQKILADETIFPRRLDHRFPLNFDSRIRQTVRLLFHAVAHLYAVHYRQLIDLQLNPHLNNYSNVNINSPEIYSTFTSNISVSYEPREFRAELETLDGLYKLLAEQWRHAYGQASALKREKQKMTNHTN